jgi:hypothetical protein
MFGVLIPCIVPKFDGARLAVDHHGPEVTATVYGLDSGDGARGEERQQVLPVERHAAGQLHRQRGFGTGSTGIIPDSAQLAWRSAVGLHERVVEAAYAAVPGGYGNVLHGQRRLVDQLLCKLEALRVGDSERARTEVPREQTPQMPARHAEAGGQAFHVAIVAGMAGNRPRLLRRRWEKR